MAASLTTYVALLRGINVGGHTTVSMAALKICFEALGFRDVRTYINSGNVIFRTAHTSRRQLETIIESALEQEFSMALRVAVRSFADMQTLIAHVPKAWQQASDQRCNIIFLRPAIDQPAILQELHPKSAIEAVHYVPGALVWSAQTSNLGKSDLLKLIGTPLYKEMTIRIFNSVRKLYDLMQITNELPV